MLRLKIYMKKPITTWAIFLMKDVGTISGVRYSTWRGLSSSPIDTAKNIDAFHFSFNCNFLFSFRRFVCYFSYLCCVWKSSFFQVFLVSFLATVIVLWHIVHVRVLVSRNGANLFKEIAPTICCRIKGQHHGPPLLVRFASCRRPWWHILHFNRNFADLIRKIR